jgi:hypothetical protein
VRAEIVHHHQIVAAQRRNERDVYETQERLTRSPALIGHQTTDAIECDCSDDGEIRSVVARRLADCSLPDERTPIERRHRHVRTRFVHKNQTRSGDFFDSLEVLPSTLDDVGAISFFGDEGLFFTGYPNRPSCTEIGSSTGNRCRRTSVTPLLKPWQFMLLTLAGWINRGQQDAIEYLRAENQVLAGQFKGKRLRLTDEQRRKLAIRGKALGRKLLGRSPRS